MNIEFLQPELNLSKIGCYGEREKVHANSKNISKFSQEWFTLRPEFSWVDIMIKIKAQIFVKMEILLMEMDT